MRTMIKTSSLLAGLVAALLAASSAWAMEFAMPVEGRLHGVGGWNPNKRAEDNLRSGGAEASLYLTPLAAWQRSKCYLSGAYDIDYSNVNNVIKIDDDFYQFVQQMNNSFEIGPGYLSSGGGKFTLKAFADYFNGKEALNDPWLLGLYDYRDIGAKLAWSQKYAGSTPWNWTAGLKFSDRVYPNYISLDADERHDKDCKIAKAYVDGEIDWNTPSKFSTQFSYSLQYVPYTQAVVVDENGSTITAANGTPLLRKDLVHTLSLDLPFQSGKQHYSLGYSLEARSSNLSKFDAQQFVYIERYEDYAEHGLNLAWTYDFGPMGFLKAPQLSFEGSASARLYGERLAQDPNGQYLSTKEIDNRYEAKIGLNSAVSEHFSTDISVDYLGIRSNNQDQSTALTNYNFVSLRLGGQFAY